MTEENKDEKTTKPSNNNKWRYTTIALIAIVVLLIAAFLWKPGETSATGGVLALSNAKANEIATKTIEFLNKNIITGNDTASLDSVSEASGILNITVLYQGRKIPIYTTEDGKFLILSSPIDTTTPIPKPEEQQQEQQPTPKTCEDLSKVDKPELDAFVVSNCPYGLQMQRVLVPVAGFFGNKANIKARYIGSVTSDGKNITSMHGDKEAIENLRQICIREEQTDKYWNYIACYIKKGDTDSCLTEAKIDKTKLNTCMNDPSKGVSYAKEDFALQDQYGVSGSPTLILNGVKVSEFDFGGRNADTVKTMVCCSFNQQPSGCSQKLSTDQASIGFSETYSGGSATGGTGSTCG
jgi:hypothetical protein